MAGKPRKVGQKEGTPDYGPQNRLAVTATQEFPLIQRFNRGYRNREDITTLPPDIMVEGSQNVLTNVYQRVGIRRGFTLDGQRDESRNPIKCSYDWERHSGNTVHVRGGGDYTNASGYLQFRFVATADGQSWNGHTFLKDEVYWIDFLTDLSSVSFNFCDFWDFNSELKDFLLFVNGESNIREWTGGVAIVKSTSNATGVIKTFKQFGEVSGVSITSGGTGYQTGDVLTLLTGSGTASIAVTALAGVITAINVLSYGGSGYTAGTDVGTLGGHGSGASIHIDTVYSNAGTGYAIGDTLTVSTGNLDATMTVTDVYSANGAIVAFTLTNPGSGYTVSVDAVNGGSGAGATFDITAIAQGYIEKEGTTSWAEEGFYNLRANRQVTGSSGTVYTYTGGENTTFLVGISPDPTGEAVGSVIFQTPIVRPNSGMTGLPTTLNNSLISNLSNQIYVADFTNRNVYVSKVNDYQNYSYSTPRMVGEGAVLTLDGTPVAFEEQQGAMYISAGKDQWYQTQFQLSSDNTAESLTIERLKTTSRQGTQSQGLTTKIKNYIAYVSFENIANTFGIDPNILQEPRTTDLSYSIVNDMQGYDFTGGFVQYFPGSPTFPGQYLLISIPQSSIVRIYNMTDPQNLYWEAPQIIPATCFSIIDGDLYFHSSQSSNTFKMFDGYTDDGHAVNAIALFAFNNQGVRTVMKSSTSCYVEGYISANTTLNLNLQRDVDGLASYYTTTIVGTDSQIVPPPPDTASLGKDSLGKHSLGGETEFTPVNATPPKFRVEKTYNSVEYFEEQVGFSSYGVGLIWEILAFGTNATPSQNEPTQIRQ